MAAKRGNEIPTIDVEMVTISVEDDGTELGFKTSSKVAVTPQVETQEANKLVVKGALIAQKPAVTTITGNTIVLTDNVFNPELLVTLQGGKITYRSGSEGPITKYEPPVAGSGEKGKPFKLNLYSAQYDAAGLIVNYEKITYPNCQGTPWSPGSEDNVWRVAEYTINSAPKTGEAPYTIEYVDTLPELT